jgi:hypothetical protein
LWGILSSKQTSTVGKGTKDTKAGACMLTADNERTRNAFKKTKEDTLAEAGERALIRK